MRFFSEPSIRVLLVCTANICRSPMAEGLMRLKLEQRDMLRKTSVHSAGTHAFQPGRPADPRAKKVCSREGIDLRKCRARQITDQDFEKYDHILALDGKNYRWLLDACPELYRDKVSLLGSWSEEARNADIPDPYYGNLAGFEAVFSMLNEPINEFVTHLTD